MCHRLKTYGDIKFINIIENKKIIEKYWKFKWYAESLYTLAMIEELYYENNIEISNKYKFIKTKNLKLFFFLNLHIWKCVCLIMKKIK